MRSDNELKSLSKLERLFPVVKYLAIFYCSKSIAGVSDFYAILIVALTAAYPYLAYVLIARDERKAKAYLEKKQYADAIYAFNDSYNFFTRNSWLDRFRSIIFLTYVKNSFRESALCSIASCHRLLEEPEMARSFYQKAADEFSDSKFATSSLQRFELTQRQTHELLSSRKQLEPTPNHTIVLSEGK